MDTGSSLSSYQTRTDGLSKRQTFILAASAGLSVANIYYAQPLLDAMARDLGISAAAVGLVVTLTQIGYGLGLIFIVPIGDIVNRRHLVIVQSLLSAIALVAVATASTALVLLVGMVSVGLLAVLVQILVAYAASLASSTQRGRVVGIVTSGVVTGILAARSMAGVVADFGGWRAVYLMSAMLMIVMAVALTSNLPRHTENRGSETYLGTLISIPRTFLGEPTLLLRGLLALLIFASFSTFWTALVFPLTAPPFLYSHGQIGLFGLVGVAGAIAATHAGRLADRGYGQWTTGASLTLLLLSWGLISLLPFSMSLLILGVLLLDLAVQAVHVTNLGVIVALHPKMNGRLIGGYMVFYSIGSAVGATAATTVYAGFGWTGVCLLGATFSAMALTAWITALLWTAQKSR